MEQLLKILDEGAFITSEEMAELAKEVRAIQRDAERYKWLTTYLGQLFMCSDQNIDSFVDRAMHRGEVK